MNYLARFSLLLLGISCSNITAANYASIPSSSSSYSFRRAFSINGAIGTSITHTNYWRGKNNNNAAYTRSSRSRRQQRQQYTPPLAVVVTPVMRNLARGSILKCLADLTGGLPLEVWKSSVVLEHISSRNNNNNNIPQSVTPSSSFTILKTILHTKGPRTLWSGLTPRMIEGLFSGGVLLAAKEGLHNVLTNVASPIITKSVGLTLPPSVIGFVSGAGGGCAQSLVMGPTSFIVTACVSAMNNNDDNEGDDDESTPVSAIEVAKRVVRERGIGGLYRGSSAVAVRQATNWASRQGFTEFVRPRIPVGGVWGELIAGCVGGTLSAWNTPFEVARIESQSGIMVAMGKDNSGGSDDGRQKGKSLVGTMCSIVEERGVGGLYVGLVPRAAQSCYQTIFLVCVPRLLQSL